MFCSLVVLNVLCCDGMRICGLLSVCLSISSIFLLPLLGRKLSYRSLDPPSAFLSSSAHQMQRQRGDKQKVESRVKQAASSCPHFVITRTAWKLHLIRLTHSFRLFLYPRCCKRKGKGFISIQVQGRVHPYHQNYGKLNTHQHDPLICIGLGIGNVQNQNSTE